MPDVTQTQMTALLLDSNLSDKERHSQLLQLMYFELKRLASAKMHHERSDHTLTPTALVHEAYLRLINQDDISWQSKGHFFKAVAEAMRRILIESARKKNSLKKGKQAIHDNRIDSVAMPTADENLLSLDVALSKLAHKDEDMATVVNLRYFAGLTVEQTAEALNRSSRSVDRLWFAARAWLLNQIQ